MLRKLIPALLAILGTGLGVAAGLLLHTSTIDPVEPAESCADTAPLTDSDLSPVHTATQDSSGHEFVKLNNQFVVPIVKDDVVSSLILISLSLEVDPHIKETVFTFEPKLRDALLQVMFDHANMGGFRGAFTNSNNLDVLKLAMNETVRKIIPEGVYAVLITDMARQDG